MTAANIGLNVTDSTSHLVTETIGAAGVRVGVFPQQATDLLSPFHPQCLLKDVSLFEQLLHVELTPHGGTLFDEATQPHTLYFAKRTLLINEINRLVNGLLQTLTLLVVCDGFTHPVSNDFVVHETTCGDIVNFIDVLTSQAQDRAVESAEPSREHLVDGNPSLVIELGRAR